MQSESDSLIQFRKSTTRTAVIILLSISIVLLINRILFYWNNHWFANPTLQGFAILIYFSILIGISALSFQKELKVHSQLEDIATRHSVWIWLSNIGWILFLGFAVMVFLNPEMQGWKDQLDIFVSLTLIIFLIGLSLFIYRSELNAIYIQRISIFIVRWKLWLLFGFLTFLKIVLITPFAHTLIAASDAYQYWEMARQLFHGSLDIANFHHYPPLYPLSIAPAFLFGERNSLMTISVLNILLSSAAVFPIYLIVRSFFSENIAFLIALLAAFNPFQWVYPAFPASENLYYLLFFWIIYFLLEKPKQDKKLPWWSLFTGILIGFSWLTRYQTMPLIPIFLAAWWLKPVRAGDGIEIKPSSEKICQLVVVLIGISICFGIWVLAGSVNGVPMKEMAGFQVEQGKGFKEQPIELLGFWSAVSLAFFILMISPVIHLILTSLLHIKSISWDQKLIRWLILAILSSGILWFTIARHAWMAIYNYETPIRLIGRYAIYAEMVLIIAAFCVFTKIESFSLKKYWFAFAFSLAIVIISYQVFSNRGWIFERESIMFLHLDGYTPLYLDWAFIFLLAISGVILGLSLIKASKETQLVLTILAVIIIQSISLPFYRNSLLKLENQGRYINEIVDQIIQSNHYNPDLSGKVTIFYPQSAQYLDHQFRVKGVDITQYTFQVLEEYPSNNQRCEPFIQIDLANGQKYGIMSKSRGCKPLPNQTIISEFSFNQRDYFLAHVTR